MSQINVRNLSNENDDGAPDIVGVSTFSATSYFVPPKGTTAQRPTNPQEGDLRFNTDTASLEYFRGDTINWEQIEMTSPDLGGVSRSTFVDSSSYRRVVTTVGGVKHSRAQTKVGSSSIYRSGAFSVIHVPDSSDFDWGTDDFTMECWIRRDAQGADEWLMAHSDGTGANTSIGMHIWSSATGGTANKPSIRFRQSSSNIDCNGTTALAANTWYHIAGVRDGNTLRIYVNGVQEGTTSISGSPDTSSAPFAFTALRTNGDSGMAGYFDEIRVSKSCRYTSGTTFTPSTTAFTSDSNTLILIHSDLGQQSIEGTGARGLFAGGLDPALSKVIDYITISTLGNTTDFGNISAGKQGMGALASRTRGINLGGYTTGYENEIEYVTIASTGNITDFGNLTAQTTRIAGTSSQTRGIGAGGGVPGGGSTNVIQYITIASTGDAVDFGDSTRAHQSQGGLASSVRGVFGGGYTDSPAATYSNTIDYITIATLGNAADFGDLTVGRLYAAGASNSTRGCWAGGNVSGGTQKNEIDYVTIASTGNAADFGDLTSARRDLAACSSPIRGVWCGGDTPTLVNTIDYVEILTTGNAVDFGDQTVSRDRISGCSNAHGGL